MSDNFDYKISAYIKRYEDLEKYQISLQYVPNHLKQQSGYVQNLRNNLAALQKNLQNLQANISKNKNTIKKLKTISLKKFFAKLKGNHKSQLSTEESVLLKNVGQEQGLIEQITALKGQLTQAVQVETQLKTQNASLINTNKQIDELMSKIFDGPTPSYPNEDRLESAFIKAQNMVNISQNKFTKLNNAKALLIHAQSSLNNALYSLRQADSMATSDMFMRGGMWNNFVDVAKHNNVNKAKSLVAQANQYINSARAVYPQLPFIQSSKVSGGNIMMDMVFDNIFTDMMIKSKIQKSVTSVTIQVNNVVKCVNWMAQEVGKCQVEYTKNFNYMNQCKVNLMSERKKIIRSFIVKSKSNFVFDKKILNEKSKYSQPPKNFFMNNVNREKKNINLNDLKMDLPNLNFVPSFNPELEEN